MNRIEIHQSFGGSPPIHHFVAAARDAARRFIDLFDRSVCVQFRGFPHLSTDLRGSYRVTLRFTVYNYLLARSITT